MDLTTDKALREIASYLGQGGTGGNINKAMENIVYHSDILQRGLILLFQVHDSLVGQVPIDKLHLIEETKPLMENECEIHGRKFIVPTEAKVGFGWGKRMRSWEPDLPLEEIIKHEQKWQQTYRGLNN